MVKFSDILCNVKGIAIFVALSLPYTGTIQDKHNPGFQKVARL